MSSGKWMFLSSGRIFQLILRVSKAGPERACSFDIRICRPMRSFDCTSLSVASQPFEKILQKEQSLLRGLSQHSTQKPIWKWAENKLLEEKNHLISISTPVQYHWDSERLRDYLTSRLKTSPSERSTPVWNEANDPAERVIPLLLLLNCSRTEYLPSCPHSKSKSKVKAKGKVVSLALLETWGV